MSVRKTFSVCVMIWLVSGTVAWADPLISNGDGTWSFWSSAGQSVIPASATPPAPPAEPDPVPIPASAPSDPIPASSPIPEVSAAASTFAAPAFRVTANPVPPGVRADAFINFGSSSYPSANLMTTGAIQPWSTSPVVEKYFGGAAPNVQQQADFTQAVLNHVQETFQLSGGLAPKLTIDPSVPTSHTLSVVSGASYPGNPNAIGITNVGGDGFSFIDKLSYSNTLDELEWAVAHNVSHELMHAFGVGAHDDQSGNYLDAAAANWSLLTDPNTRFSDAAIADIRNQAFAPSFPGSQSALQLDGDLEILATPVPEPATWALWFVAGTVVVARRRGLARGKVELA